MTVFLLVLKLFGEISYFLKYFHFKKCVYEIIYDLIVYVCLILFSANVLPYLLWFATFIYREVEILNIIVLNVLCYECISLIEF